MIASQAAVPLIYVPLKAVASKWYGAQLQRLNLNAAHAWAAG